jgi:hypothetical protein
MLDMEDNVSSIEAPWKPNLWIRERNARARVVRLLGQLDTAKHEEAASRIDSLVGGAHDGSWFARTIAWELALEQNRHLQAAAQAKGMDLVVKAIVDQAKPLSYATELNVQVWLLEAGGTVKGDLLIYRKTSRLGDQAASLHIRLFDTSEMEVLPL